MRVTHVAFEFGFGHEGGHRVHDDDVDRVAADQHLRNLQRLFAGVGLRDQQTIQVHAQRRGVVRIERVLDVNERRRSSGALRLGDRVKRKRRLAARFGAVDFHHAPAGKTADAQREVERDRAARYDLVGHSLLKISHPHDRALAELALDLREGVAQSYLTFVRHRLSVLGLVRNMRCCSGHHVHLRITLSPHDAKCMAR